MAVLGVDDGGLGAPQPDHRGVYWWETAPHEARPAARGSLDADVAIVGGGYTGLWTAHHLLAEEPSLRVLILEGERIGFGASGRNGGFAMTLLDASLARLRRTQGDAAGAAHRAVASSVEEIGATIERRGIDAEWRHGGLMTVATNPGQLTRIDADMAAAEALGLDDVHRLTAAETRDEVDSPTYLGALREAHCAVLHPAKLTHGLARAVEVMGAAIHEQTPATGMRTEANRVVVDVPDGRIRADQVVLATNAWASTTPWFRRRVMPLDTYVALTEPIDDDRWAHVGWERHQGIEDKRNFVHYYRRTLDGRILWGGRDGVPRRSIERSSLRHHAILAKLRATFEQTFPPLADVPFTHHWGGPVAMTASFLPYFGTLLEGRLHYGLGYNGHGVAPSHTGGKVLRDKVLGRTSEHTELCFVDADEVSFPPDPLAWIGAELTRRALLRQDRRMDAGQPDAAKDPLLLRIVGG